MADLIDRDALMKKICGNECGSVCDEECENAACNFYDYIMDAPVVNRRIPCSERLPEKDETVLIYAAGHSVTAFFDAVKGVFRLTESDDLFYLQSAVTHWMPLPEPPESEVQNNDKH